MVCCVYLSESHLTGDSNRYTQHMILWITNGNKYQKILINWIYFKVVLSLEMNIYWPGIQYENGHNAIKETSNETLKLR